ncbi:hypothetical protein [Nocardioides halotolerans]|uniref:hypothetical protein n=1 Tax=Nocardioides halotolerans TaxID=433660 RepID=UPI00041AC3D7|nr:hypothetical protein [Nocardioides halotolerans]
MTTTAPNRGDGSKVTGGGRRPERPVPAARSDRTSWSRIVMLVNVVLIAGVAIIGVTQLRGDQSPDRVATDPTAGAASTLADPDEGASEAPATEAPATQAPATEAPAPGGTVEAPRVKPTMRSNFAKGDRWPVGAGFRETGRLAWPLGVVDGLMTHGPAEGPNAVSWLEKWMKTDVRTIGARVQFAPNHSGSAAITAWHTSVLETSGLQQPRTGMRLALQPGAWQLVALDVHGQSTLESGTYPASGRSATFTMVRRGDTIWIIDPTGTVTQVRDPRISSLSGPWASWELRESKVGDRPAGFQEIWAG